MYEPRSFLETVSGMTRNTQESSAYKVYKLAVIDPGYVSGDPKVTFEGETTMSGKGYPYLSTYTPRAGDRVVLAPVGTGYVILGPLDGVAPITDVNNLTDFVRVTRGTSGTETAFAARRTTSSSHEFILRTDGQLRWGPGGAAGQDTILYRSAADTLKTDDSLVVGTDLSVTGTSTFTGPASFPGGVTQAITTYTPNVQGHGSAGWSRRRGYHAPLFGKLRWFLVHFLVSAAGSGTSPFQFDLPTEPNRDAAAIRQTFTAHGSGVFTSGGIYNGNAVVFAEDTGNYISRIRMNNTNITGADLLSTANITVEGVYWEV